MNLLQYNVQSLTKNKNFLEFHLKKLNIDICFLSEIFNIDENKNLSTFQDYKIMSKKRSDNYGGVAILFKNNIQYKKIPFETPLDILICQTTNLTNNLTLVSVYFPHSVKCATIKNELVKLISLVENRPNTLICGDFNARHSAYGDIYVSQRGKTIKEIFDATNFRCLNDGGYTFKKNITDLNGSVLDLSFSNSNLQIQWKIFNAMIGGSHHFPITLTFNSIKNKGQKF